MTLKEKFRDKILSFLSDNMKEENAIKCEKIADEYAIKFTDWCEDYYFASSSKGIWYDKPDFDNSKKFSTKELLEIYKKENGYVDKDN